MRVDEAYNLHGKKVRVKLVGWYDTKNLINDPYYLFYDEAEVYHVENRLTRKIEYTFSCNSWYKAIDIALWKMYEKEGKRK